MPSIHKQISLHADPASVWDVVRDVGAVHSRFAPGFVTDTVMAAPDERIVSFANGMVAREVIVDVDEARRRLAYSVRSERLTHHNASFQVIPDGAGCRLVWIADVLPAAAAQTLDAMMGEGIAAAKAALERGAADAPGPAGQLTSRA
jgi:carbon monoxide dehydrogenase subunit G